MSPSQPVQLPLQELEGTLERLTFQNEDNGYTVARLVPRGKSVEVTIVGNLIGVQVGEMLHVQGFWTNHPQYGRQFEVHSYTVEYPATVEGIRKYLGSGMVPGIGPVTASKIVDRFKLETLEIIEHHPDRLMEVNGIAEKKVARIASAWEEQKQIKEIMIFLQGYGVSTSLAVKIYKQYGDASIQVVRSDPYRLAKDIYGIGFKTADKIARQLGLPSDAPERIRAGLVYALNQLSDDGHCFALNDQLVSEAVKLLEVPPQACKDQIEFLVRSQDLIAEEGALYLPPFYYAESGVANRLRRIQLAERDRLSAFRRVDWPGLFAILDRQSLIQLTDQQKAAVRMALSEKVSILTGGPGTGKSTITASIISLLRLRGGSVLLCAPTGRAAKRLSETTGLEAKTIHRLLEYKPSGGKEFVRDSQNPLDADLIIVDETSMIDILLMNHLLDAVDVGSHLLLVGDVDQLPSVGPGNVLRDLIASQLIPVTRLETIFRQAEDSYIIVNAHHINRGEFPEFAQESKDFFLFAEADPAKAADWVIELVARRIPGRFGFNSIEDIQVLSPMHRGSVGVSELNERLQNELNPANPRRVEFRHGHRTFREQDRVMQVVNDYDLAVFNGDLGKIERIDPEDQTVLIHYDGRPVTYEFNQLDEIVHAYAISIHKAQGSEFPVVVIPVLNQHYLLLQRNLLYTGVTRARKLVVLVGSRQAISIALRNNRIAQRNTRLSSRLAKYQDPYSTDSFYPNQQGNP